MSSAKPMMPDNLNSRLSARVLKNRIHNFFLPILRLPDEVLLKIIEQYEGNGNVLYSNPLYDSSGLRIAQVFASLEGGGTGVPIAVETFAVSNTPITVLAEYVRRSRAAPLDIAIYYYLSKPEYWQAAIPILMEEVIDRVESLALYATRGLSTRPNWDQRYRMDFSSSPLKKLKAWDSSPLYKHWQTSCHVQHLDVERGYFHLGHVSPALTTLKLKDLT